MCIYWYKSTSIYSLHVICIPSWRMTIRIHIMFSSFFSSDAHNNETFARYKYLFERVKELNTTKYRVCLHFNAKIGTALFSLSWILCAIVVVVLTVNLFAILSSIANSLFLSLSFSFTHLYGKTSIIKNKLLMCQSTMNWIWSDSMNERHSDTASEWERKRGHMRTCYGCCSSHHYILCPIIATNPNATKFIAIWNEIGV